MFLFQANQVYISCAALRQSSTQELSYNPQTSFDITWTKQQVFLMVDLPENLLETFAHTPAKWWSTCTTFLCMNSCAGWSNNQSCCNALATLTLKTGALPCASLCACQQSAALKKLDLYCLQKWELMFLVQGAPTSLLIKNAAMHTFEQSHDLVAKEATTYRLQEKWAFACLLGSNKNIFLLCAHESHAIFRNSWASWVLSMASIPVRDAWTMGHSKWRRGWTSFFTCYQ